MKKSQIILISILVIALIILSGCEENISGEAIESDLDIKKDKLKLKLETDNYKEETTDVSKKIKETIITNEDNKKPSNKEIENKLNIKNVNNEMRIPTNNKIKNIINSNERDTIITLEGTEGYWVGIVSPILFDLDNDGNQELIVEMHQRNNQDKLLIINSEGTILEETVINCSIDSRPFPSIADINNDNSPEILVFCYYIPNAQPQFKIFNNEGSLVESWNVEYMVCDDLYSSIIVSDLNNDGDIEIIYGGYNGYHSALIVLNNEGEIINGFPVILGDDRSEALTPAIGNLDDNENKEIVIISRNDGNDSYWGTEDDESYISAYDIDGNELWTQIIIGNTIISDPIIANINNNEDNEIIFNSAKGLYILNNEGEYILEHILSNSMNMAHSNPALADLDNDGDLEIIFGNGYELYAIHHTGEEIFSYENEWLAHHPPIIGDLNGDNNLDIIFNSDDDIKALNTDGELLEGFPKQLNSIIAYSSPFIGDIDNDINIELISSSNWDESHIGYIHIWDFDVPYSYESTPWSQFQHDERHTGNYNSQCNDKTFLNECSLNKPKYCEEGVLINNCQECDCPSGKICQENGICNPHSGIINNTIPQTR